MGIPDVRATRKALRQGAAYGDAGESLVRSVTLQLPGWGGREPNFTAPGTSERVRGLVISFMYDDGTTEPFVFAQPDANDLVLSNLSRTLNVSRQ